MKNKSFTLLVTVLAVTLAITGCAPKTSPERHARQYIKATSDDLNPNFVVKKTDSIRMMVPFFEQFYEVGAKDKAAGISPDEALQRANYFQSEEFLQSIKSQETFAGKTYTSSGLKSAQEQKSMGEAISGAYMDGYHGVS